MRPFLLIVWCLIPLGLAAQRQLLSLKKSDVEFVSDAPLERITAVSHDATAIVDIGSREFAVRIPLRSFTGFNSRLQMEHFQENYVESEAFPNASFEGRIIEALDLAEPGTHEVRAKGRFSIHGIARERLIPCTIVAAETGLRVTSRFEVILADHGIRVPRVVQQKLAAAVSVKVDLLFGPSPSK